MDSYEKHLEARRRRRNDKSAVVETGVIPATGHSKKRKPKPIDPKIVAVCRAMDGGATLVIGRGGDRLEWKGERLNYVVPFMQLWYDGWIHQPTAPHDEARRGWHWYHSGHPFVLTEKGVALARSDA